MVTAAEAGPPRYERVRNTLTPRELDVLRRAAAGDSRRETAVFLGIREASVATYRRNVMQKLGVRTLAEAVAVFCGVTF